MTYYFKQLDINNKIITLVTYEDYYPNISNNLLIEITEEEYNAISIEIQKKTDLVEQVYRNEITIDNVPIEWQSDVQDHVNRIIMISGLYNNEEISSEEFLDMIEEVL